MKNRLMLFIRPFIPFQLPTHKTKKLFICCCCCFVLFRFCYPCMHGLQSQLFYYYYSYYFVQCAPIHTNVRRALCTLNEENQFSVWKFFPITSPILTFNMAKTTKKNYVPSSQVLNIIELDLWTIWLINDSIAVWLGAANVCSLLIHFIIVIIII